METISLVEVEQIAISLAKKFLEWGEPIPEFGTRFPNKLESCIVVPFQTFSHKHLYKGLFRKAAILFYLMIKNHPFQNGNKRIAMTTMLYFLYKNNQWIQVDNQKLYNFAKWVAASDSEVKDSTVEAIEVFLKRYSIKIKL